MPSLLFSILLALPLAALAKSPAKTYSLCQKKTQDPLAHCPDGTLYVSQNNGSDFTSIQDAINSLPQDDSPRFILIAAGTYREQLNVTRPGPLTLLGQSNNPWKGNLYSDVTYNENPQNEVQVFHDAANYQSSFPDNIDTSVLAVGPTYNATKTGSGPTGFQVPEDTPFGCSDFRAYNIDFRNEWAPRSSGPAHAVGAGYANLGFYSCGFYSYQDTVYIGKLASAVMYDCIVAGQTDFLYGFGTLFIDQSTLLLRDCGGGITAWKGTNTTFENKYGVYIADSKVLATNTTVLAASAGKCSLGRPWNSLHRSLFRSTYFDETILPAGYTVWAGKDNFNNLTTMAVYKTKGPGNNATAQAASGVTQIWDGKLARPYLWPVDVFMTPTGDQPNVHWIDAIARH
ncbi:pectin methylesterase family protein [Dactylonectria estremocensis]|uniref:pectinesterase n=1 Tax=Dactylonectria estremocensis TaxID=1079267 RepID=A0A9P9FHY3_9HYPO|nr:pectin methylesterase family protein [Dactylonectria estremocensis]